jgi:acyl carrier protein
MTNQTLTELDLTIWRNVLAPKVKGGWILHKLTTNIPLDFFVCFSSAASVWGSQGMAHYGAANHFLDQLAFYRRAHHLPALTVNWGWWSGKGIATDEQENLFAKAGLSQMPIEKALAALKFLIEIDLTQQVVADVDWAVFKPIYESTRERRFLSRIETPKSRERAISVSKSDNDSILQQLRDASLEKQKEILSNHVSQLVAEILGFGVSQSVNTRQGFFKMGMDSLMTVQLRTRLEASLDCMLPPTIAFEYPSINDLIQYLLNHVLQTSDESSDQMETIESNITSGDQQLDSLSEDEVLSLLDSELAKVDDLTKDGKLNE